MATTILPPGSTMTDLQNAINSAVSGEIIEISNDINFAGTVTIPAGKTISIKSDEENNWVLNQTTGYNNPRHFLVKDKGELILQNITLDVTTTGGGIQIGSTVNESGTLIINSGTLINNCRTNNSYGGAVYAYGKTVSIIMNDGIISNTTAPYGAVYVNGTFIMNKGVIKGSSGSFGAVYVTNGSAFTMHDGEISNNTGTTNGAVYLYDNSNFIMNGGIITKNTSSYDSGAIHASTGSSITISGGQITDNTAVRSGGAIHAMSAVVKLNDGTVISGNKAHTGGGIFLGLGNSTYGYATLSVSEKCSIINNESATDGGGIYTRDTTYSNLKISFDTIFDKNKAALAYNPPTNAAGMFPAVQFASTSIFDNPLNNYDINITTSAISYDANGGTGSYVYYFKAGESTAVLSPAVAGISFEGKTFVSWNTESDGSGKEYNPGDAITLDEDVTLYAIWMNTAGITNIASLDAEDCDGVVTTTTSNTSIVELVEVELTKTARCAWAMPGGTISYCVEVKNISEVDLFNVTFSDVLNSRLTFMGGTFTVNGITATPMIAGQRIEYKLDLPAKTEVMICFKVHVNK